MKYLTVAIPCYNSEAYMRKCIESCLVAKDDIEIIIINDGSKDNTGIIADEYKEKYPDTVKVIHQENGGHGEGVNQGIYNATSLYYKVVDSDDWVNEEAFLTLIENIKNDYNNNVSPDCYICNYVYEHVSDNTTYTMSYRKNFPSKKIFGWKDMKMFGASKCLMMHSIYFKTNLLKEDYVPLPKHTFYVDNLYMYRPLPKIKTISFLDLDLYRYFIGRDDQSVTETNLIKRLDQQVRVTKLMFASHDLKKIKKENKKLFKYMIHNLAIMMHINAAFSFLSKDKEKIKNFRNIWKELKKEDKFLYRRLRYHTTAILTNMYGPVMRGIYVFGYKMIKKVIKFG